MPTILITGANRGIGLALAHVYVRRGDRVIACCRDPESARDLAALAAQGDIRRLPLRVDQAASVAELAERLREETIDVLINNAGIIGHPLERQTAATMDFDLWEEILSINTIGPARMLQAFLPHLKRSTNPKLVNITSDLGALSNDNPIFYGYSASKAALNKYMRLAAIELLPERIAIALIHPGWVKTDMGGVNASLDPTISAAGITNVIDRITLEKTGEFLQWDGRAHAW